MVNKRIINVRPLCVAFVGLMLGILSFYGWISIKYNIKYASAYFVFGVIFFVLALTFLFLGIFFKKNKYLKLLSKHVISFVLFITFMFVGFFVCEIKVNKILNVKHFESQHLVYGKVESISEKENYTKLSLNKVVIDDKTELNGTLIVNVFSTFSNSKINLKIGDEITFQGSLNITPFKTDKINLNKYANGVIYTTSINTNEINKITNSANFLDEIRQSVNDTLHKNMNPENANIASGMLLGDRTNMDEDLQDSFTVAGVVHILAVSGLHIGFLVGLLLGICKLCKIKLKYSVIIIALVLFFYCALCNFTSSVLRASIMALVLLFSRLLGERYDALSSLSLAGICILLVFPLNLFGIGFQLSFMCVFSIITLAPTLTKLLTKIKLPSFIANTLSISVCINLAVFPMCANAFNSVSLVGILSNIFIIPLMSVTYPVLFLTTCFSLIFKFVSFTLALPNLLIHFMKLLTQLFSKISLLNFKMFNLGYLIVFFVILFGLVLQYLMVNKQVKGLICGGLFVSILAMFISGSTPKVYNLNTFHSTNQYNNESAVLTTENNKIILIEFDKYTTENLLNKMKVREINYWIVYSFSLNKISDYVKICEDYNIKTVIIPNNEGYDDYTLKALKQKVNVECLNAFKHYNEFNVNFTICNNKVLGVHLQLGQTELLFVDNLTENQFLRLNECDISDLDYLITNTVPVDLRLINFKIKNVVCSNYAEEDVNDIFLPYDTNYVIKL